MVQAYQSKRKNDHQTFTSEVKKIKSVDMILLEFPIFGWKRNFFAGYPYLYTSKVLQSIRLTHFEYGLKISTFDLIINKERFKIVFLDSLYKFDLDIEYKLNNYILLQILDSIDIIVSNTQLLFMYNIYKNLQFKWVTSI